MPCQCPANALNNALAIPPLYVGFFSRFWCCFEAPLEYVGFFLIASKVKYESHCATRTPPNTALSLFRYHLSRFVTSHIAPPTSRRLKPFSMKCFATEKSVWYGGLHSIFVKPATRKSWKPSLSWARTPATPLTCAL